MSRSTLLAQIPFTCIQFPLYERLKLLLLERHRLSVPEATSVPAYQAALVGSVSGGIAAAASTPLDVVKTRLMLAERGQAAELLGSSPASSSGVNQRFLPTLSHIYRNEGTQGLFKGVVPRTIWISIGGAVFLGSFEVGVRTLEV